MLDFMYQPILFAQQQASFGDQLLKVAYIVGIIALVFVLPFVLGTGLARALRMRGYEFKIGLILAALMLSFFVLSRAWNFEEGKFDIPLGVDLKGGVILIYEIDTSGAAKKAKDGTKDEPAADINMNDLVQALTNRINPSGTKEIVIRPYGERQVEIIIPEVETEEVEQIKREISTAGQLEFRIVASRRDHASIIAAAEEQSMSPDRFQKRVNDGDQMVGFWAQAAKEKLKVGELGDTILRDSTTGRIVTLAELSNMPDVDNSSNSGPGLDKFLKAKGLENLDVLLATDDGCNVTGDNLGVVSAGNDEYLNPCVNFRLRGEGAQLFSLLTSANRPDMDANPPFYRHLAIMLDERLLSFPRLITTISESGRITGDFTKDEVDFLVGILRAGRLPATLKKEPISENQIGSMLGDDTIRKGKVSIVVSLVAVLVFVAVYYRFSGLVACAALLMNLVMIMATMVLLNAPLTLPGLAGLVLTIGMSVDANVLIFERIREEVARGAALRMAIRNGFARATVTIVDANVTTLITAMVLYAIGTDQIRGFAVTLILGILMSMFTAIFCSRVVFDVAEKRHWITELKMMKILGTTQLDFIGKRRVVAAGSVILIVIGLIAVGARGKEIFDIDFNGGVSVTMVLQDPMSPDEVRARLVDHFKDANPPVKCTVNTVSVADRDDNTFYKIDADIQENNVKDLEDAIKETFRDESGNSELRSYVMDVSELKEEALSTVDVISPQKVVPAKVEQPAAEKDETAKPAATEPTGPATPEEPAQPEADAQTEPKEDAATEPKKETSDGETSDGETSDGETSQRDDLPADTMLAWTGPNWVAVQDEPAASEADTAAETAASDQGDVPAKPAATGGEEETPAAPTAAPGETVTPETAAPETVTPETVTPETAAPETVTPETAAPETAAPDATAIAGVKTIAKLKLGEAINTPTLREKIRTAYNHWHTIDKPAAEGDANAAEEKTLEVPGLVVCPNDTFNWDQKSAASSDVWYVSMIAPQAEAEHVLAQMKSDLADTPVFPSSSKIGGKVAGDTRNLAIAALIASLFGIVGYIWIRFQRVVFGVAAVIALLHDILITLGAIAISAYVARPLGFLQIEEFRISLPIVAAFLTIIGYSLNDTIVVFDRIREVRGKSPDLTAEMMNTSINQTLSRTLLTSLTTLIVVAILYAIGGQGIHGFAFALVIGVLVGTYSSIFIAAPALLWMFNANKDNS